MNKELEAFRRFRDNAKFDNKTEYYLSTQYIDDSDIVETALKRLEELDSSYTLTNHNGKFYVVIDKTEFDQILKQLKALEIIKEKMYSWSKLYINTDEQRVSNVLTVYDIDNEEKKLLKEIL